MSKKIALSKKLRTALAAGAIPSTSIAAVGDFFWSKTGVRAHFLRNHSHGELRLEQMAHG